ncbi:MAG: hypothetical protein ACOH2J_02895 [Allorhizobium sp.]
MPIPAPLKTLACVALVSAGLAIAPAHADDFADLSKLSQDSIAANTACLVTLAKKLGRQPNDAELNGFSADCLTQRSMVTQPEQAADGAISVVSTLGSTTADGAVDSGFTLTMICKDKATYVFLQSDTKFVSKEPKLEAWFASLPGARSTWDADEDSFFLLGDEAIALLKSLKQNSSETLVLSTTDETMTEHHYDLASIGPAVTAVSTACGWK